MLYHDFRLIFLYPHKVVLTIRKLFKHEILHCKALQMHRCDNCLEIYDKRFVPITVSSFLDYEVLLIETPIVNIKIGILTLPMYQRHSYVLVKCLLDSCLFFHCLFPVIAPFVSLIV